MANSVVKFGRGRGRLAVATRKWADSLRVGGDLSGSVLILVELARDAADLADAARREGDGRLYLSAASRLQLLMERSERACDRERVGGAGSDAGEDDGSDELAELLGSGPEVGDAAES